MPADKQHRFDSSELKTPPGVVRSERFAAAIVRRGRVGPSRAAAGRASDGWAADDPFRRAWHATGMGAYTGPMLPNADGDERGYRDDGPIDPLAESIGPPMARHILRRAARIRTHFSTSNLQRRMTSRFRSPVLALFRLLER